MRELKIIEYKLGQINCPVHYQNRLCSVDQFWFKYQGSCWYAKVNGYTSIWLCCSQGGLDDVIKCQYGRDVAELVVSAWVLDKNVTHVICVILWHM